MTNKTAEAFHFFRAWLAEPLRVAAVTPSGRALSALMTAEISADTGPVIELGPGTGVFTHALIQRGVAEPNLVLIECGSDFAAKLRVRFPSARTMQMDAAKLRHIKLFDRTLAGAVLSGLPVLSMPARKVIAILDGAFGHLHPEGAFYQFTYGPRCPIPRSLLDRMGLKATHVGHTFANIPPAAVYRIRRRTPRRASAQMLRLQMSPADEWPSAPGRPSNDQ
ncbi:phospholipid methyltransferase [Mesorhizobium sp. SB112]|uniref:class I SAM-dependent methyltransferase n=1 Tax=Mesorhizobium sp. SB112 TaxID=3151853 RepID=UPI0032667A16